LPAQNIAEIKQYFGKEKINKPDLILDGGKLKNKPSTVINFIGPEPIILRTGVLSKAELDQVLNSIYTKKYA